MATSDEAPAASAYAAAGVDIEKKNRAFKMMSEAVRSTYGPEVLWGIGISLGVACGVEMMDHRMEFFAAGCDFMTEKLP